MKKLLIIGDGFVGKELCEYFRHHFLVTNTDKKTLDICDDKSIEQFFSENLYDYIIHAAGIKDVSYCDKNFDEAMSVNANSVVKILKETTCKKFIYISSDYVFDGERGDYTELDVPNPKTVYGKSKLLGEVNTFIYSNNYAIVRTSGIYGKGCFWLEKLFEKLDSQNTMSCFSNIFNTPTYSIHLAEMIHDLIKKDYIGLIHLSGGQRLNRHELYSKIAKTFNKNPLLLEMSESNNFPRDLSLCNIKYLNLFKTSNKNIDVTLEDLQKRYEN